VINHAQNFNSAHGKVNTSLNGSEHGPRRDYLANTLPAT
jgi:hypothetical protein